MKLPTRHIYLPGVKLYCNLDTDDFKYHGWLYDPESGYVRKATEKQYAKAQSLTMSHHGLPKLSFSNISLDKLVEAITLSITATDDKRANELIALTKALFQFASNDLLEFAKGQALLRVARGRE